jgi:beta-lactam-binding protein with PASTA domain
MKRLVIAPAITLAALALAAPACPEALASNQITLPEVTGQNAEIVYKKLEKLGLTDVTLSSANPKYSMVLNYSNWTVVSIDPAAGTSVDADDPVVVKVTKQ